MAPNYRVFVKHHFSRWLPHAPPRTSPLAHAHLQIHPSPIPPGMGGLPYEKVRYVHQEFLFRSLKGCDSSFFLPLKGTKTYSIQNWKHMFHNKGFILLWKFTSLAPEPLSFTVSTPKCYSLMFSKRYQNSRFWALSGMTSQPHSTRHPWPFHMGVSPRETPPSPIPLSRFVNLALHVWLRHTGRSCLDSHSCFIRWRGRLWPDCCWNRKLGCIGWVGKFLTNTGRAGSCWHHRGIGRLGMSVSGHLTASVVRGWGLIDKCAGHLGRGAGFSGLAWRRLVCLPCSAHLRWVLVLIIGSLASIQPKGDEQENQSQDKDNRSSNATVRQIALGGQPILSAKAARTRGFGEEADHCHDKASQHEKNG